MSLPVFRAFPYFATLCLILPVGVTTSAQEPAPAVNPYTQLMTKAAAHAKAHGALPPVLSPNDATVLSGQVPVEQLQRQGIQVIPWTTNEPEKMRAVLRLAPDGLISDRPDLLRQVVTEDRAAHPGKLRPINVQGHRGGRGLRPENTLPAFEAGLDNLIDTIETDTGVTSDHVSLIWHDQFLNPQSCRKVDGSPYTMENRVYIRDLSIVEAQKTFICDKLHAQAFPNQRNDLALSPVAVAFAASEHLISPYVPTHAEQLFRFTAFYAAYYSRGAGKTHPEAQARASAAAKVHFNLETKILPDRPAVARSQDIDIPAEMFDNHTVSPQTFVDTLCGAIARNHMEARADVQSFDFRTLILVEEQYPKIQTVYLTENPAILSTGFVPAALRQQP